MLLVVVGEVVADCPSITDLSSLTAFPIVSFLSLSGLAIWHTSRRGLCFSEHRAGFAERNRSRDSLSLVEAFFSL